MVPRLVLAGNQGRSKVETATKGSLATVGYNITGLGLPLVHLRGSPCLILIASLCWAVNVSQV